MKKSKNRSVFAGLNFYLLGILLMVFACSPDTPLRNEENLDGQNAKSKNSMVKEMAYGAAIKGTNGMDIGPDGNLYVASFVGGEIKVLDKKNGKIIKSIGAEKGVMSPDDIVFGPDGSLYWTDILLGEVGRMKPDGSVTKQFVALGVNPITFSADGRLFVALDFLGDGLYELDPNLTEAPRAIVVASEAIQFPLGFLNSFEVGTDGRLYGPLFAVGIVVSINVDPLVTLPTSNPFGDGLVQVVASGFVTPVATKFGPDGMLYVLDQTGEVFKVNTLTGEKTLFAQLQAGLDNLTFDSNGTLYISNADHGWVVEMLPSGKARTISHGGMITPQGLAVLPTSNDKDALFVADLFRLRKLDGRSGKEENNYKGYLVPEGPNSLILPMSLSADENKLIVSSWFSGAIQVWDPITNQVEENFVMGAPIDAIRFKNDLVNDILASDIGLGGVVWASDHAMILPIDNVNVFAPSGLATDGEHVWVADWGTGIIWQIGFEGKTALAPVPIVFGLLNPEGITLDTKGNLLVVETGAGRLSKVNLATGEISTIAEGLEYSGAALPGYPPTWFFDSVAIGQSGDIYVSGAGKNVIYRISQ